MQEISMRSKSCSIENEKNCHANRISCQFQVNLHNLRLVGKHEAHK